LEKARKLWTLLYLSTYKASKLEKEQCFLIRGPFRTVRMDCSWLR
ncbi:hypothetical protein EG68_11017, partial [Paragonimus skrjabini miyazakii]